MPKYLYHYAPAKFAERIVREGLLSTRLQHGVDPYDKEGSGWRKYKERAANRGFPKTREGVLRWLDASLPDFRRSYAVSALSEPIPDSDEGLHHGLAELRDHSVVVRIQPAAKLLAAGVITDIWKTGVQGRGNGRHVKDTSTAPLRWSHSDTGAGFSFSHIPHYMLETADGHIPPEYLEVMGKKAASDDIEDMARPMYPESGSHGWNHIQDVLGRAEAMTGRPLSDEQRAALMLHDIGLYPDGPASPEVREGHEERSADMAGKLLGGRFDANRLARVLAAIREHRASYTGKFTSDLSDLLSSADRNPPDVVASLRRGQAWNDEHGITGDAGYRRVAEFMAGKYGNGGYARYPKHYRKLYRNELADFQREMAALTPERVKELLEKRASIDGDYHVLEPFDNGAYEFTGKNEYTYTGNGNRDGNGRTVTITGEMLPSAQYTNEQLAETPGYEVMSEITGLPSYREAYNNYWASIPDEQWNKTFNPATRAERSGYSWGTPKFVSHNFPITPLYSGYHGGIFMPTSDNWLPHRPGTVRGFNQTPLLLRDRDDAFQGDNRTLGIYNAMAEKLNPIVYPHEYTHYLHVPAKNLLTYTAAQLSRNGASKEEIDDQLEHMRRMEEKQPGLLPLIGDDEAAAMNGLHPTLRDDLLEDRLRFYPEVGALEEEPRLNRYTGDAMEEAQAIHAFRDGIIRAQDLLKNRPELFSQFTQEERELLRGTNPWFKSPEELADTMHEFMQSPYIAQMLGPEALRALSIAKDYDNMSSFWLDVTGDDDKEMTWPEAIRTGSDEFKRYMDTVRRGKKRFYDMFMADNRGSATDNINRFLKTATAAEGIPDRADQGDLAKLREGLAYLVRQKHLAARAGLHEDLRIGGPEGLYSWAVPKFLPEVENVRRLAIRQPLHDWSYKDFSGKIGAGYGKGSVSKLEESPVIVLKNTGDHLMFTRGDRRDAPVYNMVRTKGDSWLLSIQAPGQPPVIRSYPKEHFKMVPVDKLPELIANGATVTRKIDGAGTLLYLGKNGVRAFGIRTGADGLKPEYTDAIGGLRSLRVPKELQGMVLRGEVFGRNGKLVISPNALAGVLNATIRNAYYKKQDGTRLLVAALAVHDKGVDTYDQDKVNDIVRRLNSPAVMGMETYRGARALRALERMRSGNDPLTSEGFVVHQPGKRPLKAKFRDDADVVIRRIFRADTDADERAGGFEYSLPGSDKVVGRVGTGFDHATLRDMLANPDSYVGRTARIRAQEQYPGGAYRAPSFVVIKED